MKTVATLLLVGVLTVSGCRTAEPLPEVMSEAEFDARMARLEQWRDEQIALCDDADCRTAVTRAYLDRVTLLWEENIDQIEARWDAQRRRAR